MALIIPPLNDVNSENHKIVAGNHDNYNAFTPHFLGDYGWHSFPLKNGKDFKFFFIRGAYSIDRQYRILNVSYWENEELSWDQMYKLLPIWEKEKPEIVMSHDAPAILIPYLIREYNHFSGRPSRTSQFLDNLFAIHKPRIWIFGHWHQNNVINVLETKFVCLNGQTPYSDMGFIDFDEDGELIGEPQ